MVAAAPCFERDVNTTLYPNTMNCWRTSFMVAYKNPYIAGLRLLHVLLSSREHSWYSIAVVMGCFIIHHTHSWAITLFLLVRRHWNRTYWNSLILVVNKLQQLIGLLLFALRCCRRACQSADSNLAASILCRELKIKCTSGYWNRVLV